MRSTRALPPLLLLCLAPDVIVCPRAAAATHSRDSWDAAKGHFDRGAALYQAGRFREAEDAFLQAYELSRLPDLLFNLAKAAEKQGRPRDAAEYLERYLRDKPNAPDRGKIELERQLLLAQAAPPPPPSPSPPPPPPRRRLPPTPALALAGGGLGLLVIGIACGGAALSAQAQVSSAAAGTRFDKELHQRGQALSSAAITFDVIGALALGAGAAWTGAWLYQDRPWRAALLPRGLGLQLVGSF